MARSQGEGPGPIAVVKHTILVRAGAEADIAAAAIWYEQQRPGLGREFVADIDDAIAIAVANPFRFPCLRRRPEARRILTRRFPYRVFFVRQGDKLVVFRVLHSARHDREWRSNIPTP